ncbi:MAG TPA: lipopolysaccharide biosynthesis protein [Beijerinckiaceae bacterium]|nr:lipopolysaccharide biosynthesis protein [Beijerinckiaceae bacterium]
MTRVMSLVRRIDRSKLAALAPLAIRIAAAGLAAVLQVVLARLLGADDYGIFAWAWALVAVGGYATTFGLSQTAVRHLALYAEQKDSAAAQGFLRFSMLCVIAGSSALAAVTALPVLAGAIPWIEANRLVPMLIVLAIIPFFALGDLAEGFARSQGWSVLALAPGYVMRQLLLILLLPAIWLLGKTPTVTTGLTVALVATAMTALVQMALVLQRLKSVFARGEIRHDDRPRWLSAAGPVFLADIVQVLRQNVDVLILAAFAPPAQVAVYFAATRVASLLGLVEFAVGAAAAHRFARIDAKHDAGALDRAVRESAILTFWPTLFAAVLLWLISPLVLALFGEGYRSANELVLVLALGAVLRASVGPADDLLTMQGHGAMNLVAQAVGLATVSLTAIVLVPKLGPSGAALSVLFATGATTFALALASGRRIGIVPLPLPSLILARRQTA